jgi:hypothetical protein
LFSFSQFRSSLLLLFVLQLRRFLFLFLFLFRRKAKAAMAALTSVAASLTLNTKVTAINKQQTKKQLHFHYKVARGFVVCYLH